MRRIIGDQEAFLKAFREEMEKEEKKRNIILWDEVPALPRQKTIQQILMERRKIQSLFYMTWPQLDQETQELYEKYKRDYLKEDD